MVSVMIRQCFPHLHWPIIKSLRRSGVACETLSENKASEITTLAYGVTLIETRDSRIDMLIALMANNVPRKRIYMVASSAAMARPHHGKVESAL